MNIIETKNIEEAIYGYERFNLLIHREEYAEDEVPKSCYAIWGKNVNDPRVKQPLSPDTMYIFRFTKSGNLLPGHVTYRRSTLCNFEKQRKRFAWQYE